MFTFKAIDDYILHSLNNALQPFDIDRLKRFFNSGSSARLNSETVFYALKVILRMCDFGTFQDFFLLLSINQQRSLLAQFKIDLLVEAVQTRQYFAMRALIVNYQFQPLSDDDLKDVLFICADQCNIRATMHFLECEQGAMLSEHLMNVLAFINTQIVSNINEIDKPNNTLTCNHYHEWKKLFNVVLHYCQIKCTALRMATYVTQPDILHQYAIHRSVEDDLKAVLPERLGAPSRSIKYKRV